MELVFVFLAIWDSIVKKSILEYLLIINKIRIVKIIVLIPIRDYA